MKSLAAEMESIRNKMKVLAILYIPAKIFEIAWCCSPPILLYLYLTK